MRSNQFIGIDLGGTKLNLGRVQQGQLLSQHKFKIENNFNSDMLLEKMIAAISEQLTPEVAGIGIGVPGQVDSEGVIHELINIPYWKQVPLKSILQQHFSLPVTITNDASCFMLGESRFGKARDYQHVAGLCLGTGIGLGLVLNNQLYTGTNSGAGEIGEQPYLHGKFDTYVSGRFFKDHFNKNGEQLLVLADQGDNQAIEAFRLFGVHLSKAIQHVLLAYDPQLIVIGGSVSNAWNHFIDQVWLELRQFPFQLAIDNLKIERSEDSNIALLGAAALCLQPKWNKG